MSRCSICRAVIWPWQHFGFRTTVDGRTTWHTSCVAEPAGASARREVPAEVAKDPRPIR